MLAGMLLLANLNLLAQSVGDDDPANLKGERVRAIEAEPLEADRGAKGVAGLLKKLGTRASLLMIVAHPDDEDGGMLAYESRGVGARVGMLTLTRGEGGQNVMSGDFNDALGLVRTRELLAADQYLGVDQMFGTEVDFGFSKTKEEAFSQWTHERVLYDAVRAVRLYRPLVLTSVFLGAPTDGHGQHQVSGEITQEVFTAAADPKVFPEMGLPAWAPAKVYGRMPFAQVDGRGMFDYATGKYVPARFYNYVTKQWSTKAPEPTVTVPEGERSSLLDASYVQFARQGLALQKTQIGSNVRLAPAGRFDVGYTRYGSRVDAKNKEDNFFAGIDVSLAGIASLAPDLDLQQRAKLKQELRQIDRSVVQASTQLQAGSVEKVAPLLRDGLVETRALIAEVAAAKVPATERYNLLHELRVKEVQFQEALGEALELTLRAEVIEDGAAGEKLVPLKSRHGQDAPQAAVRRQAFTVEVEFQNQGPAVLRVHDETSRFARNTAIEHGDTQRAGSNELKPRDVRDELMHLDVNGDAPLTQPYFSRPDLEQPFYDLHDRRLRNAPTTPPALTVWKCVQYGDVSFLLGAVVQVRPPGKEEVRQPLQVVPPMSVTAEPKFLVIPKEREGIPLVVSVRSEQRGVAAGTVNLSLPPGWKAQPEERTYRTEGGAPGQTMAFALRPGPGNVQAKAVTASATLAATSYGEGYRPVGYAGIIHDHLYEPATTQVRGVDMVVPAGLKVAYLPGTGDAVEGTFAEMGVAARRISVAEVAAGKLAGYDALVLGVRAYAAHKDLAGVTPQIEGFARAGGTVVVQYNTAEFGGNEAPYPLSLGSAEKVVEEHAPVRLLEPGNQLLSWPNRITEHDFDGWVEERGHGFMAEWDPRYIALTEVHDAATGPAEGRAPGGEGWEGFLCLLRLRALSAAARRSSRSLPLAGKHGQPWA